MGGPSDEPSLVELLYLQWLRDGGSWADWCRAHPDEAEALAALHRRSASAVDGASASEHESASIHVRLAEQWGHEVDPQVSLRSLSSMSSNELLGRLKGGPSSSRYRVDGEIGAGGMGAVFQVWDADLRRHLAMKVILERPSGDRARDASAQRKALERFLEEAQVTGQLEHPGIVPVHELGLDDRGQVFFTMKLVRGKTLTEVFEALWKGEGDWNQERVLGLILRVCEAMRYAHDKGVIHRDLKPANIMVGRYGEVYVMDWGLARLIGRDDASESTRHAASGTLSEVRSNRRDLGGDSPDSPLLTMEGDVVGTPAYMPPEQAMGRLDQVGAQSDVYAVGAILYHLLAGQLPYVQPEARVDNYILLRWVQDGPPKPIGQLAPRAAPELVSICEKAMARDLRERYHDMTLLAQDLTAYLEGRVVRAHEFGAWVELRKWVHRNKGLSSVLGSSVVMLIAGLVLTWSLMKRAEGWAGEASANAETASQNAELARENEEKAQANADLANARADFVEVQQYVGSFRAAKAWYDLGDFRRAVDELELCDERRRGWEWRWLARALDPSLLVVGGGPVDFLRDARFSPDGDRLAVASHNGGSAVWSTETGECLFKLDNDWDGIGSGAQVCFSPDGSLMAFFYEFDRRLVVLDSDSGEEVWRIEDVTGLTLCGFTPDGTELVVKQAAAIHFLDAVTGPEVPSLASERLRGRLQLDSAFDRVAQFDDGTFRLRDVLSGDLLFEGESSVPHAVVEQETRSQYDEARALMGPGAASFLPAKQAGPHFSPQGDWIATSYWGRTDVWDPEGRQNPLFSLPAQAQFGPLGLVGFFGRDAFLWTYDALRSGSMVPEVTFSHPAWVTSAVSSPDGLFVLTTSTDGAVRIFASSTGVQRALLAGHRKDVSYVEFSKDGERFLTMSRDSVRVWDTRTEHLALSKRLDTGVGWLSSETALSADCSRWAVLTEDGVRVWDTTTLEQMGERRFPTRLAAPTATGEAATPSSRGLPRITTRLHVAMSSDGGSVATGPHGNTVEIWDVDGGEASRWELGEGAASALAFDSRTGWLAVGSSDGTVSFGPSEIGVHESRRKLHTQSVAWLGFSSDGRHLVSCDSEGSVGVWQVTDAGDLSLVYQTDFYLLVRPDSSSSGLAPSQPGSVHIDLAGGRVCVRNDPEWGSDSNPSAGANRQAMTELLREGLIDLQVPGSDFASMVWRKLFLERDQTSSSGRVLPRKYEAAIFDESATRVFVAGRDGVVRVFDTQTGLLLLEIPHESWVVDLQFDEAGERLFTATADGVLTVWHARSNREGRRVPATQR